MLGGEKGVLVEFADDNATQSRDKKKGWAQLNLTGTGTKQDNTPLPKNCLSGCFSLSPPFHRKFQRQI